MLLAWTSQVLTAVLQLLAAAACRSAALLAAAILSGAAACNQALLLLGRQRYEKKADELHPFGFAPDTYFWSFVVAIFLFGTGALATIFAGLHGLRQPLLPDRPTVAYGVLLFSLLATGLSLRALLRAVNRERGQQGVCSHLRTFKKIEQSVVLLENGAVLAGSLIALAGSALTQSAAKSFLSDWPHC